MLEIAEVVEAAATSKAAWIAAGATVFTAGAAGFAALWASQAQGSAAQIASQAQESAAKIASSGAMQGGAQERWAKHQDDKRDLYAEFLAAAYGSDQELRAKYDHLLEHVRLMTTPATEDRIEALGPVPEAVLRPRGTNSGMC